MAPKKKQEKMNLGEFLTNQSLGSWADEMDAQPLPPPSAAYGAGGRDRGEQRSFTQPAWESARTGGGAMMDARGASYDRPRFAEREQLPLPTRPPFTAHLGNLAYDVTQTDIEDFLRDCHTTSIRIVEDKLDRKPKGFGYVEFATLDGLKTALAKTESSFMGRNIKISVAEPPKERAESSRDLSDWSRKGPLPDLPQNTRQPSNRGFSRNFDNMSDAGSERGGTRRSAFFDADNKVRDFGNWERKGPLSPVPTAGPPLRDGGRLRDAGPPRERGPSPAWGEGRSETGSRPPRPERAPTAAEMDNQWRAKMKPDTSPAPTTPDASAPTSPAAKEVPKERPRLNLAKRTVSTTPAPADAAAVAPSDKASPFGAARPIDTATREREIDEKRALAARQRQEAELKAKEEKAAQDAAARAARAERADRGQMVEETGGKSYIPAGAQTAPRGGAASGGNRRMSRQPQQQQQQNGMKSPLPPPQQQHQQHQHQQQQAKENGETKERPSFTILSREENGEDADEGEEEGAEGAGAPPNGTVVGSNKATQPTEVVVPEADGAKSTAQELDEEGWSTVASKGKNARRGGGGAGAPRAVAS